MNKPGRNEPCHCGSGKKYKHCHFKEDTKKNNSNKSLIIGGIIIVFIVVAALMAYLKSAQNGGRGPAPDGKVWSKEHGHYH
ncbi:SEC-C metal-binding domain-containing protein [Fulvivirga lutea]|uniref:SEC-C domain-containing protein n=1 Tax=Fulvivirga lutea TaxID=2810512 RepID=A0A975A0Q0_9BACT|nr:SEC-C metal-binding domain-containing protein [Fulvivirga lutea]QSE96687.1 SEC-C domain-containing protein [Fulvivirga lutea]